MSSSREIPASFKELRDVLLEFSSERSNINTHRATTFIESEGLIAKPSITVRRRDIPALERIVGDSGLLGESLGENGGVYSRGLDLAVVIDHERKQREDIYTDGSTLSMEGILVHELAHGSSTLTTYKDIGQGSIYIPRSGFGVTVFTRDGVSRGDFLEEGFADFLRGKYISQNMSDIQKTKLSEHIGYGTLSLDDTLPIPTISGSFVPLPVKYLGMNEQQLLPTVHSSAFAGYAIELLCNANQDLYNALVKSRTSVDGLREAAKQINQIAPGLYSFLQSSGGGLEEFKQATGEIIQRICGDISRVVQGNEIVLATWDSILETNAH